MRQRERLLFENNDATELKRTLERLVWMSKPAKTQ